MSCFWPEHPSVPAAQSRHLSWEPLTVILPAQQEKPSTSSLEAEHILVPQTRWLITLLYTSIFCTVMVKDPPSISKHRAQMDRFIVFLKHKVHAIFSSHGEVTPSWPQETVQNSTEVNPGYKIHPRNWAGTQTGSSYSALTKALHSQLHIEFKSNTNVCM